LGDAKYNQRHKDVLDALLLDIPFVRAGKMFGYPAYYVGGKLFACVYGDAVGVKVSETLAKELLEREEIDRFQPMGKRKMREWIQIYRETSEDYKKDKDIFLMSVEFVAALAGLDLTRT
jgi:predicted DNA-binding protein (MmcQ/YjbR family)